MASSLVVGFVTLAIGVGALFQGTLASIAPSSTADPAFMKSPWTEGTYINCGGPALNGSVADWQADTYVTSGESFVQMQSSSLNNFATTDPGIFGSLRFFGAQGGPTNTYSIPVPSAGYYFVRLYFAEILYTSTTPRRFNVSVEGVPVLGNFEVPLVQEGVVREFFVPVTDGFADITFIRGEIGDPMISAIAVTPVPTGMYALNTTSGTVLGTEYRISAGALTPVVDKAGRVWAPDTATPFIFSPPKVNTSNFNTLWNTTQVLQIFGNPADPLYAFLSACDVVPELAPAAVFSNFRATLGDMTPDGAVPPQVAALNYTLPVATSTPYMLRISLAWHGGPFDGSYVFNMTVDGVTVLSNVDLYSLINSSKLYFQDIYVTSSASSNMLISFTPVIGKHSVHAGVWAQGIELFRVQQFNATAETALVAAGSAPSVTRIASSGQLWMGLGIGVVVGVAAVVAVLLLLAFCPLCFRRSGKGVDLESAKSSKGPSKFAPSVHSGPLGFLLGKTVEAETEFIGVEKGKGEMSSVPRNPLFGTQFIPLADLQAATADFAESNILGHGGFGVVYRAVLSNGVTVAVKRLDLRSSQGEKEFMMEVELLSRLHHRHLVNLMGYCDEEEQLMLVYEYVPNGTLREHLRDEEAAQAFTWGSRLRVALGAARGIEYLHRGASPPVIHRDIKTSNILLDFNFDAKVADFGLSKLGSQQSHISTHVKGTLGYLDPSYYTKHHLTEKSDVYSFGVVLLELLTGRMPIWQEEGEGEDGERLVNLVDWSAPFLKGGNVGPIAALQLDVGPSLPSMEVVAKVARMCVEVQGKLRPMMADVVRELEEAKRVFGLRSTPPPSLPTLESSFVKEKALAMPKEGSSLSISFISAT